MKIVVDLNRCQSMDRSSLLRRKCSIFTVNNHSNMTTTQKTNCVYRSSGAAACPVQAISISKDDDDDVGNHQGGRL